jgi:hypothetical protein
MIANYSKGHLVANGMARLRAEPHFGAVKGIINAFKPQSAILLGSSERTAAYMHKYVERFMAVDFEQSRYDKNLAPLPSKAEFYPKSFPVYDDKLITGPEGLSLSDLYSRIASFFKDSDLLVIDHIPTIAIGALSYFGENTDIAIIRGIDPDKINAQDFRKYRMTMGYSETSTVLVKNHIPVETDTITKTVHASTEAFYKEINLRPAFRFARV